MTARREQLSALKALGEHSFITDEGVWPEPHHCGLIKLCDKKAARRGSLDRSSNWTSDSTGLGWKFWHFEGRADGFCGQKKPDLSFQVGELFGKAFSQSFESSKFNLLPRSGSLILETIMTFCSNLFPVCPWSFALLQRITVNTSREPNLFIYCFIFKQFTASFASREIAEEEEEKNLAFQLSSSCELKWNGASKLFPFCLLFKALNFSEGWDWKGRVQCDETKRKVALWCRWMLARAARKKSVEHKPTKEVFPFTSYMERFRCFLFLACSVLMSMLFTACCSTIKSDASSAR